MDRSTGSPRVGTNAVLWSVVCREKASSTFGLRATRGDRLSRCTEKVSKTPLSNSAKTLPVASALNGVPNPFDFGTEPSLWFSLTEENTMGKGKRVAIYVRVSTDGQTTVNQQRELEAIADRHGWTVVEVFRDHGISGKHDEDKRPALKRLLGGVHRKDFDIVAAWSVDRLGRSLQHLLTFLAELKAKGVDLYLHQQGVDTSTPAGKALFQMLGVFAEFERAMIVERVQAGLRRARAQGKQLGRPRVAEKIERTIRVELAKGRGIRAVAEAVGVGTGTVQRVKAEATR